MRSIKCLCLIAALSTLSFVSPPRSHAQIAVQIGPAPVCPYGYYAFPPYNCAPYGYYGPEWFNGGFFIGAGPWFHGRRDFHGYIDRRYDPRYGYHGGFPRRGEHPDWEHHRDFNHNFHGNEMRDGRGHVVRRERRDDHERH